MTEPWSYAISPPARRDLRRLDPPDVRRIGAALDRLVENPRIADIRKLRGSTEWRLRVGDLRVRFTFDAQARIINVTRVLPRGRAYDR